MSRLRPLRGSCACGRIEYLVSMPTDATEEAKLFFDDNSDSRRSQAAPLTAWLRVPITWYQSATIPRYPDETHSAIRRIFTPLHAPHCKRIFCGFCGTHLSYWTEQPREEAEFLNITVGSLVEDDLRELEDLGLIPEDISPGSLLAQSQLGSNSHELLKREHPRVLAGLPWFEDFIKGSRLGRTGRTRKGLGMSADGTTTVEWEVTEWVDDGSSADLGPATGKRKMDVLAERDGRDEQMQGN